MSPERRKTGTPAVSRRSFFSPPEQGGPVRRFLRKTAAPLLFWLAVWQLSAMWVGRQAIAAAWAAGDTAAAWQAALTGKALLLPGPVLVLQTLWTLAVTPEFWLTAGASLLRIFAGFAAGTVLGAALAACTYAWGWADALLSPAIRVLRATPVASFIILILLWVRTGLVPGVISGLMVLPVVWANVHKGLSMTDPLLLEAGRAFRFGRWKTAGLVYLPSVLPYFASGCTTALGLAWKAGVAAEVLCLPRRAIGAQVYYSKLYLETPSLFAWTAAVVILSLVLERVLEGLLGRLRGGPAWK